MDETQALQIITDVCNNVAVNWSQQQAIRQALDIIAKILLESKKPKE